MTQAEALNLLKLGHNIFLTGAAGSGKTHLLNKYIGHLREHGVEVAVTAPTGIAATHLGGQTVHSWAGLGVREGFSDEEIAELSAKPRIKRNFSRAKVLVIDEVSMLHPFQLEIVDRLARAIREAGKPFGGLQVILCGDFFQLPPVSKSFQNEADDKKFAYECLAWEEGGFQVCYLEEQFRHGNDPILSVLNSIRRGDAGEEAKAPLRTRYKKEPQGGRAATRLFVRNVNVDALNEAELEKLKGEEKVFRMTERGFKQLVETLKRNTIAPEKLRLKAGAEVMFIKNAADGRYVNGTRGAVAGFDDDEGFPVVRTLSGEEILARPEEWRLEEDGAVRASVSQVPLRLAWAITVHKSQGMTLDTAEVDLSDAFEPGMGYVALSRVRSLSGLKLMGLNETALSVHPKVLRHDERFRQWSAEAAEVLGRFKETDLADRHEKVLFDRLGGLKDKTQVKKGRQRKSGTGKEPTHEVTRRLVEEGKSLAQIAKERNLAESTIIGHLEKLKGLDRLPSIEHLKPPKRDLDKILAAFAESKDGKLLPVFDKLGKKYSFETLRLARLFVG